MVTDYLGIEAVEAALARKGAAIGGEIHERMQELLDHCKSLAAGQPTDILGRISVVFEGRRDWES